MKVVWCVLEAPCDLLLEIDLQLVELALRGVKNKSVDLRVGRRLEPVEVCLQPPSLPTNQSGRCSVVWHSLAYPLSPMLSPPALSLGQREETDLDRVGLVDVQTLLHDVQLDQPAGPLQTPPDPGGISMATSAKGCDGLRRTRCNHPKVGEPHIILRLDPIELGLVQPVHIPNPLDPAVQGAERIVLHRGKDPTAVVVPDNQDVPDFQVLHRVLHRRRRSTGSCQPPAAPCSTQAGSWRRAVEKLLRSC